MKTSSKWMILFCGMLFGAGLAWSGMIKPEVVLSFLRFQDFGLLLVLGSAVTTTFICYQLVPKLMRKPVLEDQFGKHVLVDNKNTLMGAVLFGVGWGISGVCPGPAIAGLGAGNWPLFFCLAGMFLGSYVQGVLASKSE